VAHLAFGPQYNDKRIPLVRSEYEDIAASFTEQYGRLKSTR
jgi:hypothetical protein